MKYPDGQEVRTGDWYEGAGATIFQIQSIEPYGALVISMLHGSGPHLATDTSVHRGSARFVRRGVVGDTFEP